LKKFSGYKQFKTTLWTDANEPTQNLPLPTLPHSPELPIDARPSEISEL